MMRVMSLSRMMMHLAALAVFFTAGCSAPMVESVPGITAYVPVQQQQRPREEVRQTVQYSPPPQPAYFASPSNVSHSAPAIHAASYILVNAKNGTVLAARDADSPRHVASTQKVLTALIVAESGNLDARVRIAPSDVAVEPSKLGVRAGETYTRRELLIAFLVKSANDVAAALARDNAGSVAAFAERMNAKARSLGATNSHFGNPHGLTSPGQHSTARDMARIGMAAYNNAVVRDAVGRRTFAFRYANGRRVTLENTNELLGRMPECDGMKTGYTGPAGRCLISTAHTWGREVLLVQLGTQTKYIWNDGAALMRWGLGK
jgi:D-alanyl-D-alanine carboxypeptidase (penicillin-binding protein 5/6)